MRLTKNLLASKRMELEQLIFYSEGFLTNRYIDQFLALGRKDSLEFIKEQSRQWAISWSEGFRQIGEFLCSLMKRMSVREINDFAQEIRKLLEKVIEGINLIGIYFTQPILPIEQEQNCFYKLRSVELRIETISPLMSKLRAKLLVTEKCSFTRGTTKSFWADELFKKKNYEMLSRSEVL